MQHWINQLESKTDPETAQAVVGLLAAALVSAAFIAGNWHLIF